MSRLLLCLAAGVFFPGGVDEAERLMAESLRYSTDAGDSWMLAAAKGQGLSRIALAKGDYLGAEAHCREALAIFDTLGEGERIWEVTILLVDSLVKQGRSAE